MPNSNLTPSRAVVVFVDYIPAETRIGKDWIIVYYAKNPLTQKMERQRLRVPAIKNKKERLKHAGRIVTEINKKLESGWSPFLENPGKSFRTLQECINTFTEQTEKEMKDGIKRADTVRSYKSFLSMVQLYIKVKNVKINFVLEFNRDFIVNYLDWVYYDRQNSPTTYNNHLLFLKTFSNFLIARGYLKENPTTGILKKRELEKTRQVFTTKIKKIIAEKLPEYNPAYFTLCMTTYFALVRRTELTKLKVSHIVLKEDCIFIPGTLGKNPRKDEFVTIPDALKPLLAEHINGANQQDYVFSADGFRPGASKLTPKKISDTWATFQKKEGISKEFQWYAFKDTGITDLINSGMPLLKVRDQARHSDLKMTERYTARVKKGDAEIKKSLHAFFTA